jgi:quercetin dioxygenase-like cupin family protein
MKNLILDIQKHKKFNNDKPQKETLWTGDTSRINLMNLLPGQEIKPHIHDGDHIWVVLEGSGVLLSSEGEAKAIITGNIIIAPKGQYHGVRNNSNENLVFASITV